MLKVKSLEVSVSAHATEDPSRVLEVLMQFIPEECRGDIETLSFKGYYGNPILIFKVELSGLNAEKALDNMFSRLSDSDVYNIISSFDLRFANSRLYLRFDKQEALFNRLRIVEGDDVVRVVVKFGGRGANSKVKVLEFLKSKVFKS